MVYYKLFCHIIWSLMYIPAIAECLKLNTNFLLEIPKLYLDFHKIYKWEITFAYIQVKQKLSRSGIRYQLS